MTRPFARLGLPSPLVDALAERGIVEPFPIQTTTIPAALTGRDISGKAPTGSGKTLAFGLPLLARVERADRHRPRALVLAPTRELAGQIHRELSPLAAAARRTVDVVYGGVGYGPQRAALRRGVDVLVATPGRLEDLIAQGVVDLGLSEIVVVDEADRMADMGFLPAVRRILDGTSPHRQTLLFSATLDEDVAVLSRDYQRDPLRCEAGVVESETVVGRHHFWLVQRTDRARHAADIVGAAGRTIVFTRTRHGADRLARQLAKFGIGAAALHGGRSQSQRGKALQAFMSGGTQALVATDVAARGLHVDAVASVVHFDPPADHKSYLHRSGRTARAGATGTVVSLVTDDQRHEVRQIQQRLGCRAPIEAPRIDALRNDGYPPGDDGTDSVDSRRSLARPGSTSQPKPSRPGTPSRDVYVGNLPWETTAEDLERLFGHHGEVHQATIVSDRRTGRSRGFGFVQMPSHAAGTAIEALHESVHSGRRITVRVARQRRHPA